MEFEGNKLTRRRSAAPHFPMQDSHLQVGHAVEIVGKVTNELSVKVLASTDFGTNIGRFLFLARCIDTSGRRGRSATGRGTRVADGADGPGTFLQISMRSMRLWMRRIGIGRFSTAMASDDLAGAPVESS